MDHDTTPAAAPMDARLAIGEQFVGQVLAPMKAAFVGKDEIIDLLGVSLVAGENLFILGPPGTAKSALVRDLGNRLLGRTFDYLLTRFTEPNELFGPFDIRRLREGDLVTNTEGMLPEADLIFLDELLNANSAILNSLLMVLNERVFRRGRESRLLPTLMVVGASNRLPEDDALAAMFDRFLLRVRCDNVATDRLADVLDAGWHLDTRAHNIPATVTIDDVRKLHGLLGRVNLGPVRQPFVDLVVRLRYAGIAISDRRAVKLQRLAAASALLCGRFEAELGDLWVFRYVWDTDDQADVLKGIVRDVLGGSSSDRGSGSHPRSRPPETVDAEALARDLERIEQRAARTEGENGHLSVLRDRLSVLTARCEWIDDATQREFLQGRIAALWQRLGGQP